jgi:hypothetical protein
MLLAGVLAGAVSGAAVQDRPVSLPLEFEVNVGQFAPDVLYLARTGNHFVYLTRSGMTLGLTNENEPGAILPMRLVGANQRTSIAPEARAGGVSNYFIGSDPAKWKRGVAHFGRVRYSNVWPGIDLVFHGKGESLEYDFVLSPGSDPGTIRLSYPSALKTRLDSNGDLMLTTAHGEVLQRRPEIYQEVAGVQRRLDGGYRLSASHEIQFDVRVYDRNVPLVIDPVLTYSTYLAGTGTARANAIALDASGNLYVMGQVSSPDFPASGSTQTQAGSVGLYRSQDRAASWAQAGPGVGPSKVQALTPDPKNNAVLYAGTSHGVFKTSDGGLTWKAASGLPADTVTGIAVDPNNSNVVYACLSEGLYQRRCRWNLEIHSVDSSAQRRGGHHQGGVGLRRPGIGPDYAEHGWRRELAGGEFRGHSQHPCYRSDECLHDLCGYERFRFSSEHGRRHHLDRQQHRDRDGSGSPDDLQRGD